MIQTIETSYPHPVILRGMIARYWHLRTTAPGHSAQCAAMMATERRAITDRLARIASRSEYRSITVIL